MRWRVPFTNCFSVPGYAASCILAVTLFVLCDPWPTGLLPVNQESTALFEVRKADVFLVKLTGKAPCKDSPIGFRPSNSRAAFASLWIPLHGCSALFTSSPYRSAVVSLSTPHPTQGSSSFCFRSPPGIFCTGFLSSHRGISPLLSSSCKNALPSLLLFSLEMLCSLLLSTWILCLKVFRKSLYRWWSEASLHSWNIVPQKEEDVCLLGIATIQG